MNEVYVWMRVRERERKQVTIHLNKWHLCVHDTNENVKQMSKELRSKVKWSKVNKNRFIDIRA